MKKHSWTTKDPSGRAPLVNQFTKKHRRTTKDPSGRAPLVNKFMKRGAAYFLFLILVLPLRASAESSILRVYYDTLEDISRLQEHYDVHEYNNTNEYYVLVAGNPDIAAQLAHEGWRVETDLRRTQILNDEEMLTFKDGYRTINEIYAELNTVTGRYPVITELVDYGDGYCKGKGGDITPGGETQQVHDLLAVRVTNRDIPGPKPVFFLMTGIHAREITTPELAMRFLDWLVDGYGFNADATWLVDWHEIWIVPSVNPEGHWLVELGDDPKYDKGGFLQRKNANKDDGCTVWWPTSYRQYGVDLNRNFNFKWGTAGSSLEPCSPVFRGPVPSSEPEVFQLQNLIKSLFPDQRGTNITNAAPETATGLLISIHSYSKLVLWPWGHTSNPPPNETGLRSIGEKFASYNGYFPKQGYYLYPTSGDTTDWAYGDLGLAAYTFEVGDQFFSPYDEIDAVQWPTNKPALIYAAKIARTPYMTVKGPDVTRLALTPGENSNIILSCMIDDTDNGGQNSTGAVYYLDIPPWVPGSTGITMNAVGGEEFGPVISVEASLQLPDITNQNTLIFVQGIDSDGNRGAVSAIFLSDVPEPAFPLVVFVIILTTIIKSR
jgi:hypothetical protein